MIRTTDNSGPRNEDGFILVATLVTLLLIVVLGVSATNNSSIELQIAGNDRLDTTAFYQAESTAYQAAQLLKDDTATTGSQTAGALNGSTYLITDNGIASGSSLNMTQSQVHSYAITGSVTLTNNASNSITIGYKKRQ